MGTRDKSNSDVWVLYQKVTAMHEGMVLYADSAMLNTRQNDFRAFRQIKIVLTDTTFIYGDRLYYDGNQRVVNIWADTVVFVDGATVLKTPRLTYDRNTDIATFEHWGHTVNGTRTLDSRKGRYDAKIKEFFIHNEVVLQDEGSRLETDTLYYNMNTSMATFIGPTHIYSDSTTIYSEKGHYNTDTRYAESYRQSQVETNDKRLNADTLYYDEATEHGRAFGHVVISDTTNNITSTGRYGETNGAQHYSYVTDSALVVMVDNGDSLFLHADTIWVTTDSTQALASVRAYRHVKVYRHDAQAMCDSIYYDAADSLATLFGRPVLWYEQYQCFADTIDVEHDSTHVSLSHLRGGCFVAEQVDDLRYNQIKGKQGVVHFAEGEPSYADIVGNAQMVYFIKDNDTATLPALIGANVGIGSQMRIYFVDRKPDRMVTYGSPDMHTYPPSQLPKEWRRLTGFLWMAEKRPKNRHDVFKW